MTKLFKKSKKPFGAILGPFYSNLGKNEFSWKKGALSVWNIPIIYHRAKNQKKLWPIPENAEWLTDRLADRQTENGDFIRPSSDGNPVSASQSQLFFREGVTSYPPNKYFNIFP